MKMRTQFSKLREFYRNELGHWLWIVAIAFLILIVLGFLIGLFFPHVAENAMAYFAQGVEDLGVVDDQGNFSAIALFFNNFRSIVTGIAWGFVPFIFLTALSMGVNSMVLGLFAAVYMNRAIPMASYFAALFPHGIFEIPAMLLSFSCGLYLCHIVTKFVRNNQKGLVKEAVMNILRVLLLNITPLLLIAAVLEAYVTPLFTELFPH